MKIISIALILMVGLASTALAEPIVDAGTWNLLPDQGNQHIYVTISDVPGVTNATLFEQIIGTTSPLPFFTGGSMIDDTIFLSDFYAYPSEVAGQLAYLDGMLDAGAADGNGVLARLTVSTQGVNGGDFILKLTNTSDGNTLVGMEPEIAVTYKNGLIHIIPEPGAAALVICGMPGWIVWRMMRRRGEKY
jgi:hypothetical protein